MSRLFLVCAFLMGMLMTASGFATAQDVDVAAVSEAALAADPEALATGLATPPDDAMLPDGFINPPSGEPANADIIEPLVGAFGGLQGSVGTVTHGFDTNSSIVPGVISSGILTYVVNDEEIDADYLNEIEALLAQGLDAATPVANESSTNATPAAGGPTTDGSVQRIDIDGTEAIVTSVSAELGPISAAVEVIAVPVGNTLVIGTVIVADQGEVDQEQVRGFAEALTLAGVEHLGAVAEGAQ